MEADWGSVSRTLQVNPKQAKKWTKLRIDGSQDSRLLPLHQACSQNPTLPVIMSLIESYPKALKKKDSAYSRLPLHIACLKMAPVEVIVALLEASPESAQCQSSSRRLPLHYACASGAPKETIAVLLAAYPEAAQCTDLSGWLPIHLCCIQNGSYEICKQLTNVYPQSVFMKTKKGNMPEQCMKLVPECENKTKTIAVLKEVMREQIDKPRINNVTSKVVKERCANSELC